MWKKNNRHVYWMKPKKLEELIGKKNLSDRFYGGGVSGRLLRDGSAEEGREGRRKKKKWGKQVGIGKKRGGKVWVGGKAGVGKNGEKVNGE